MRLCRSCITFSQFEDWPSPTSQLTVFMNIAYYVSLALSSACWKMLVGQIASQVTSVKQLEYWHKVFGFHALRSQILMRLISFECHRAYWLWQRCCWSRLYTQNSNISPLPNRPPQFRRKCLSSEPILIREVSVQRRAGGGSHNSAPRDRR